MWIQVTKKSIFRVRTLPYSRMQGFSRNTSVPTIKATFLHGDEKIRNKGRGVDINALPHPWEDVVYFI